MIVSLRDLYVLLECGKFALRIHGNPTGFDVETVREVVNKLINELDNIKVDIDSK